MFNCIMIKFILMTHIYRIECRVDFYTTFQDDLFRVALLRSTVLFFVKISENLRWK